MFFGPSSAAIAQAVACKMSAEHQRRAFERERHTYYITGGRPRVRSEPRAPYYTPEPYRPAQSSDCGISVSALIVGGLLFGGLG